MYSLIVLISQRSLKFVSPLNWLGSIALLEYTVHAVKVLSFTQFRIGISLHYLV